MFEQKKRRNGKLALILAALALLVALSSIRFWEQLATTALP